MGDARAYVGSDVHKDTIAVAITDGGRRREVRFWGNIAHTRADLQWLAGKIAERHGEVEFTYEAGPCG
jgi:hypothetical protein